MRLLFAIIVLVGILSGCASTPRDIVVEDLSRFFPAGNACFVLQDTKRGLLVKHNEARCETRFSPCSTFKIPNSLIGLETGVIKGLDHEFKWDGVSREREELNKNHNLRTAFSSSVVWYYQELARGVGKERMDGFLRKLHYGNMDTSGGLTQFWLNDSLTISAEEQVAFLRKLHKHDLPFSGKTQDTVLELMVIERKPEYVLRGKTGSGRGKDGAPDLGWFVGSVEKDGDFYYFAANVSGDETWGPLAKKAALDILKDRGILPKDS